MFRSLFWISRSLLALAIFMLFPSISPALAQAPGLAGKACVATAVANNDTRFPSS